MIETKPPPHLRPTTRAWWASAVAEYALEPHHLHLLTLAGEALDRCQQARRALAKEGLTFTDKAGCPHPRPEVAIERDSRLAFARLVRELDLDTQAAVETYQRAPALLSNGRRRA